MLTTAQTWTLLGGVFGLVLAVVGLATSSTRNEQGSLRREMLAEMGGLRTEMRAGFAATDARLVAVTQIMDTRFDSVEHRLDGVDRRLDGLDSDVDAMSRRVFGTD